jgi:molybdopterin-guanine dinucleotide biosynthesis protein A
MTITPLILAGGRSTRMKSPKHHLGMPDGRPLYQHHIDLLSAACPNAPTIYISLAPDSERDDFLRSVPVANTTPFTTNTTTGPTPNPTLNDTHLSSEPAEKKEPKPKPQILLLHDLPTTNPSPSSPRESSGPATGLLTAHAFSPATTWLTIPCDLPFLTPHLLRHLCKEYQPPVTCFRNSDGFLEPLVAVWGPEALKVLLERTVEVLGEVGKGEGKGTEEPGKGKGKGVSPAAVVRELNGRGIPVDEVEGDGAMGRGLVGVNTREEWEAALRVLETEGTASR